ncbi:Rieske 2Fe-2S domain-containing protein [Corynebacterium uropygiale]|uniref:Rieske 2Fe-2S domain-containing protein n=1 Tax=Corynebacterium uropygiale TaxID=1775911 RepID=A0A9X1QQ85_9CORY|nr:Rieske 2Fe-2S domain-containing protein [Corynebacterium uropygiale]MCF4007647.1 Rieske 2Fe-2S domain-containing protein [Corynebacterium uropygiale]
MTHHAPFQCSRRLFLAGVGTTFAGALLAACGDSTAEVAATDVPVGSAVIVGKFIVAQPTAGEYRAYSTVCPHQGSTINAVDGDTVVCPAHGSVFSIADGSVLTGPSGQPLTAAHLEENAGTLSVGQ